MKRPPRQRVRNAAGWLSERWQSSTQYDIVSHTGHCYFSGQATKIPAHFMRREVMPMWKKALQFLLLTAILLLALSTKACWPLDGNRMVSWYNILAIKSGAWLQVTVSPFVFIIADGGLLSSREKRKGTQQLLCQWIWLWSSNLFQFYMLNGISVWACIYISVKHYFTELLG